MKYIGEFSAINCRECIVRSFILILFITCFSFCIKVPSGAAPYTPSPTLEEIVVQTSSEPRNFNFVKATDVYTVGSNLGTVTAGTLNINGVASDDTLSIIDFDGNSGFKLNNATNLTISNVEIKNAYSSNGAGVIYNGNNSSFINIDNAKFVDNYAISTTDYAYGAVIGNYGLIGNIVADFTNNYTKASKNKSGWFGAGGSAIFNYGEKASIDSIRGKFVGNYAINTKASYVAGGAIYNRNGAKISTLNADFTNNYIYSGTAYVYGGVIYNNLATIENINGNFTNNYAISDSNYAFGGVIGNYGTIGNVVGNFFGNYAKGNRNLSGVYYGAIGGVIYNYTTDAKISSISGKFENNYVKNTGLSRAAGGAIYNRNGAEIESINADFVGNYAYSTEGSVEGGAIANYSKLDDVSGNFTNNYVISGSSSAKGGAIYTETNLNIVADNNTSKFSGNYVQVGTGDKQYEAIYVGSVDATLTLNAKNNGTIQFDDYINGESGYNVNITGDGTGTVKMYNDIKNADVSVENVTFDIVDDKIHNYSVNTLNSNQNAKYSIDIDIASGTSDSFVTANVSSGVITLDTLNFIDNKSLSDFIESNQKIQILFTQNNDLQLAISDSLQAIFDQFSTSDVKNYKEVVNPTTSWNVELYNYDNYGYALGIHLTTTNTKNDSLATGTILVGEKIKLDTLAELNRLETSEVRNFNFDDSDNVYTVNENLGISNTGVLNINGIANGDARSTIDFNGKSGFQLSNATTLNLSNVEIKNSYRLNSAGALYVTNSSAVVNIDNVLFSGNYVSSSSYASGGAIYNSTSATIGDIIGSFSYNYATSSHSSYGGAIYNSGSATIGDIIGDFSDNYASSSSYASGGAIYNSSSSTIGDITGDFSGNYVSSSSSASGGAIYNSGSNIGDIKGDFSGNYVSSSSSSSSGGAIYNTGTITSITNSKFTGNYAYSDETSGNYVKGGAIYTTKNLNIVADNGTSLFSGNYVQQGSSGSKNSEAIHVSYSSATITLEAKNNGTIQFDDYIDGVTGYNVNITGDSTGTVKMYNDIKNADVSVENVTCDLSDKKAHTYDVNTLVSSDNANYIIDIDMSSTPVSDKFVTANESQGLVVIDNINFVNNQDTADEFVVQVLDTQNDNLQLALSERFSQNVNDNVIGKVIISEDYEEVNSTTYYDDVYTKNVVSDNMYGSIELSKTQTTNDSLQIVIATKERIETTENIDDTLGYVNKSEVNGEKEFLFDSATNVYNASDSMGESAAGTFNINGVSSNDKTSTINFNGNSGFELSNETEMNVNDTTLKGAVGTSGAVFNVTNENAKLSLTNTSLKNNSSTSKGGAIYSVSNVDVTADASSSVFSGNAAGGKSNAIYIDNVDSKLTLTAKNNGRIVLDDAIDGTNGYKVNIEGDEQSKVTVNNKISRAELLLGSTNIDVTNEEHFDNLSSLSLNNTTVNIANRSVGTINTPTLTLTGTSTLSVDVDLAKGTMDRITAENYSISQNAVLNVNKLNLLSPTTKSTLSILFADENFANNVAYTGKSTVAYSPIFKYKASYAVDENDKQGYFTFVRGSTSSSSSFNPSVLASAIATQAGTYTAQLQALNYAFQHADMYMNDPTSVRISQKHKNHYAVSSADGVGVFSPLMSGTRNAGYWVKPYATFEDVPLKHGPKVSSINYGTLFGYDTPMETTKYGWDRVFTHYIGYNGANMHFSGNSAYQNGGMIGTTLSLYKGKFFNATTISAGATVGEASTMYGSENYTSFVTSIGNKTGYNIEFKEGLFILQPSVLLSYTFINTFDYTNSAGVRIDSDPMSAIQIAPTLKFITNTKNGWQPYFAVGMVWNIMAHAETTVGGIKTPDMYIKPYVQYGLGVQKRFAEKFLGFAQAMIYNGGRSGVMLTAGFRWMLGK